MANDLFNAIKHFHPKARTVINDRVIVEWDDPDGAPKPNETALENQWKAAGRPVKVSPPSRSLEKIAQALVDKGILTDAETRK